MLRNTSLLLVLFFSVSLMSAQEKRIEIKEEKTANRLALYAHNVTDTDYDVKITVSGTNFRQPKSKPRYIRVPGISKVQLINLIITKGKFPNYTYELEVKDSLSRRALKKSSKKIKVNPRVPITIYVTEGCVTCDSLINPLNNSKYIFKSLNLAERPEVKRELKMALPKIDSIIKPIVSLGGKIFPKVETFEQLEEELNKE